MVTLHLFPAYGGHDQYVRKSLQVGTMNRTYLMYKPKNGTAAEPVPLVVVLHGSSANGLIMSHCSGFNALAERYRFIALYPDSYGPLWNDGRVDPNSPSFRNGVDDVLFISRLIDATVATGLVDPKRVYLAGFSNGGMMALRFGIAEPGKIAAIACISGLLPKHLSILRPARPVPLLMMHGTDDSIVPWVGGVLKCGNKQKGEVLSVLDTVSWWARNNGCASQVNIRILPDTDTSDGTVGFIISYGCATPDTDVTLVTIQGGGHTWPGAVSSLYRPNVGKICHDFDAAQFIWDYFSPHRLH